MGYTVKFPTSSIEKKFLKVLKALPEDIQKKIKAGVMAMGNEPRPYDEPKIKPPLEIYDYTAQYRLRIGDYRVLYDIDDRRKAVWILALRKRNERTYWRN